MNLFIAIASVLTLLVVAWLLRALLRPAAASPVSSQQLNIDIYRDQLEGVERDLARGAITVQDAEASRDELQLRMLDDAQDAPGAVPGASPWVSAKVTASVVALLIVTGSAGMYRWLGNPRAMDPVAASNAERDKVMQMVEGLAQRLKTNPDNPQGWAMLARSYKVMGRVDDAISAYQKAGSLIETEPDLMADYADLLAVRAGDNLQGAPMELVRKALVINPKHPMSLMLAAAQSYREGNFKQAVAHWETLVAELPPESPDAAQLQSYIADAREKGGLAGAKPAPKAGPKAADSGAATSPSGNATPANAAAGNPQILQMVERLATRLQSNPGDLEGWARLARSYKVLGRMADAEAAYAKAGPLVEKTPDMLTDLADLLATRAGGNLEGRPTVLINKALKLAPQHPMGLMLAGTAAYRRGDFPQAIGHWEKLSGLVQPGTQDAQWVASSLADARAALARKGN